MCFKLCPTTCTVLSISIPRRCSFPAVQAAAVRATLAVAPNISNENPDRHIRAGTTGAAASPAPTITVGDIVEAYTLVKWLFENIRQNNRTMCKLWHRNYYEHIIRNDQSYQRIAEYITNNPAKWNGDKFYTE